MPTSDEHFTDVICQDVDWQALSASSIVFEGAIFMRVKLAKSKLRSIQLRDVSLTNCDLANADWSGASINRAQWLTTRFTGLNGSEAHYRDIQFDDCMGKYAIFHRSTFDRCRFERCDLSDATFEGATLRKVAFIDCELVNVRFIDTTLADVDLRGSRLHGFQADPQNLRGVTVDSLQTEAVAALTGVKIEAA